MSSNNFHAVKKMKVCFIERSIQSVGPLKSLYALYRLFIPPPSRLLREVFSHAAITCEDFSLIFPLPSIIARYSFIQLSGLGRREENENAQISKRYPTGLEHGGTV